MLDKTLDRMQSHQENPTEAPKIPTLLENKVLGILGVTHPLDSPQFDPTDYMNKLFPNEQSLASIDTVIHKIEYKMTDTSLEAERLTNAQSELGNTGAKELGKAKEAIKELFQKIQDIKAKAAQSETMVHAITQDVKSLDYAKRHLTHSVTALKRLQMLVTAVDQLETLSHNKQYKDSAQLLQAVVQLMQHFKSYKSVPQIAQLSDRITKLKLHLEEFVLQEFDQGFNGDGTLVGQPWLLNDACFVASVLGEEPKEKILKKYIDLQLMSYRQIFRLSEETSQIIHISRRYAFLKRILKICDEKHSEIFPVAWCASGRLCQQFCDYTKIDLESLLTSSPQLDVKELLKALQLTIEFEGQLKKRYEKHASEAQSLRSVKLIGKKEEPVFHFERSISACFIPYLWIYINAEDKTLKIMIESYTLSDKSVEDDTNMTVLPSSTDLFYFYRETLAQCAKFSTGKALWDLCQLFSKYLYSYCNVIILSESVLNEKRVITSEYFRFVSLALNTADYCYITTAQLEEKLKETIDSEYTEKVDLKDVQETFMNAVSICIDTITRGIESNCEAYFQQMAKLSWGTMDTVGDQSVYVSALQDSIKRSIVIAGKTIANKRYFRTLNDRFAESFLSKYLLNIFKCRPVSEIGAEQMLLDTHTIKTLLMDIPFMRPEGSMTIPTSYAKLVNKGISKVEAILKIVMTPIDPIDGYIENYIFLIGDKHMVNFTRILDLKGLKKPEQSPLVEAMQRKILHTEELKDNSGILPSIDQVTATPISNLPSSITTSFSTIATSASNFSPNALQQFGGVGKTGRLNENFRKLVMTGMAFRKDLQDRRDQQHN
ncbi:Vps53-like protein [Spinellus fusiger]|nr:Vps53-like protein [Spinellus fusiger]